MHPILFESENFVVESYKIILVLSILLSIIKFRQLILETNIDFYLTISLGVISILIGSKIYEYLYNYNFSGLFNFKNGFNSVGALFGGIMVLIFISKRFKISYLYLLDRFSITVCLGYAVGKLACLSAGCCYGIIYDGPISITFTDIRCGTPPLNIPLFPSQLVDSISSFCIFLVLNYHIKKKHVNGRIFMQFCLLFGLFRLVSTFYRAPDLNGWNIGKFFISKNQFIFLCLFLLGSCSGLFPQMLYKLNSFKELCKIPPK